MAELFLEIITPSKLFYSGKIKSVTVPGTAGSFQVLVNHAPLLSTFEIGVVKIGFEDGKNMFYATGGGTIEVNNNKILILADSIEAVESIDADRARRAKERALERLQKRGDQNVDIPRAEEALRRAINRLNLVEKRIRSEV